MASSLVKEVGGVSTTSSNSACFDRESRKNKYDNGVPITAEGRVYSIQPIHYGCGQERE